MTVPDQVVSVPKPNKIETVSHSPKVQIILAASFILKV